MENPSARRRELWLGPEVVLGHTCRLSHACMVHYWTPQPWGIAWGAGSLVLPGHCTFCLTWQNAYSQNAFVLLLATGTGNPPHQYCTVCRLTELSSEHAMGTVTVNNGPDAPCSCMNSGRGDNFFFFGQQGAWSLPYLPSCTACGSAGKASHEAGTGKTAESSLPACVGR